MTRSHSPQHCNLGPDPLCRQARHTEERKTNIRDLETRAWKTLSRTPVLVQEIQAQGFHDEIQAQGFHDDDDTNACRYDPPRQAKTTRDEGDSGLVSPGSWATRYLYGTAGVTQQQVVVSELEPGNRDQKANAQDVHSIAMQNPTPRPATWANHTCLSSFPSWTRKRTQGCKTEGSAHTRVAGKSSRSQRRTLAELVEGGFDVSNQEGGPRRWPGHGEPTSGILRTACPFSPRRQSTKTGLIGLRMCVASWSLRSPRPTP